MSNKWVILGIIPLTLSLGIKEPTPPDYHAFIAVPQTKTEISASIKEAEGHPDNGRLQSGSSPKGNLGQEEIIEIIKQAARRHGVSEYWLERVAKCESGFNPRAENWGYWVGDKSNHPTGLFQYLPSTWRNNQGQDIWNAYDQAELTARLFKEGKSYLWECK